MKIDYIYIKSRKLLSGAYNVLSNTENVSSISAIVLSSDKNFVLRAEKELSSKVLKCFFSFLKLFTVT